MLWSRLHLSALNRCCHRSTSLNSCLSIPTFPSLLLNLTARQGWDQGQQAQGAEKLHTPVVSVGATETPLHTRARGRKCEMLQSAAISRNHGHTQSPHLINHQEGAENQPPFHQLITTVNHIFINLKRNCQHSPYFPPHAPSPISQIAILYQSGHMLSFQYTSGQLPMYINFQTLLSCLFSTSAYTPFPRSQQHTSFLYR